MRGRNNRDRNRPPPQGEGVLPVVAYTGYLRPKGQLFQASGIPKGRGYIR